MTNVFTNTPVYSGRRGDCARVTSFHCCVLIRVLDGVAEEAVTVAMTPEQARALAQGIIEAADRAEGKQ